jgi:hypothetical protein
MSATSTDTAKVTANHKIGRCANGAERDQGYVLHAIIDGSWTAACGAQPGHKSAGWSSYPKPAEEVNCPRCLKKLKAPCPYCGLRCGDACAEIGL